jgi:hypothetical protein
LVLFLILAVFAGVGNHSNDSLLNTDTNRVVNQDVVMKDVSIYEGDFQQFKVGGTFKTNKDMSYLSFGAQVHLNDGTTTSESIVKNYNNIQAGTEYNIDGNLLQFQMNKGALSDISSVDFT